MKLIYENKLVSGLTPGFFLSWWYVNNFHTIPVLPQFWLSVILVDYKKMLK